MNDTYPAPVGDIDLAQRARELGITHFLPTVASYTRDSVAVMIPVCNARSFQQHGCDMAGFMDFGTPLEGSKLNAVPVPDTLVQLPWDPTLGWIVCELFLDQKPFYGCPRRTLRTVLQKAKEKNLIIRTGLEYEFMLFKKDSHEGHVENDTEWSNLCSSKHIRKYKGFCQKISNALDELGWHPEKVEKEAMKHQFEVAIRYNEALISADRHLFVKFMLKSLAETEGYRALFMPMPFQPQNNGGNGLHLNLSLWDATSDTINLIPDSNNQKLGISVLAEHALAGIMENLDALCALSCPTINSYKRLHALSNFLSLKAYARESRWPALRIPLTTPDRLEYRVADGAVNPYLLPAAVTAACLSGINNKTALKPEEYIDNAIMQNFTIGAPRVKNYHFLPRDLEKACACLRENEVMKSYLGNDLITNFMKLKETEVEAYQQQVTQQEIARADDY